MSSKFSGILAQARKRQNDEEEIDLAEEAETSSSNVVPEPQIEAAKPVEPPAKAVAEKPASKPKTNPKAKPTAATAQSQPKPKATPAPTVADEPVRRGRPQGKRSDPDYTQITAYITKATHKQVKLALLEQGDGQEISEVIEECLRDWIAKRK